MMKQKTDHVSPATRSAIMRAVKSKGARSTERRLRAALIAQGLRGWRMHADDLPGKPDFVFMSKRVAVFVDGCFWHGCSTCYRRPHSNQTYWDTKVAGNIARDRRNRTRLRYMKWRILRVWEHEVTKSPRAVVARLEKLVAQC